MGDIIQHEQLQCCRKSIEKTKGYKDKKGETDAIVRKKKGTDGRLDREDVNQDQGKGITLPIAKTEIYVTDFFRRFIIKKHLQPNGAQPKGKGPQL